jgi:hypothetical protein
MTSPPSPPNRRRRRIIAGLIAVLVVGTGWCFWPAGPNLDPRLIGDWRNGPIVRRFNADGTFETLGTPIPMTGYRWSVEDGEIAITKPRTITSQLQSALTWLISKFTRQAWLTLSPSRFELVEVTADKLRIKAIRRQVTTEEVYDRIED